MQSLTAVKENWFDSIEIETPPLNMTVHQASSLTGPPLWPLVADSVPLQIFLPVALAGIKVGVSSLFGTRLRLLKEFNFQQGKKKKGRCGLKFSSGHALKKIIYLLQENSL